MEPTKPQIREAFLKAMNRGDPETAAKIAVYSVLTPEMADSFACSLIAVCASIMFAREEGFKEEDLVYARRGIDSGCEKLELELSPNHRELLMNLTLKWIAKERTIWTVNEK